MSRVSVMVDSVVVFPVHTNKGEGSQTPALNRFHFGSKAQTARTVLAALRTARTLAVATSSSMPTPQTTRPSGVTHST
ncbi:MAG: hypothetical protein K0R64_2646 [Novosphingobium lindaniclasticum]|nr:hypothetical protein [Novosphingobium lindaniclasticum]